MRTCLLSRLPTLLVALFTVVPSVVAQRLTLGAVVGTSVTGDFRPGSFDTGPGTVISGPYDEHPTLRYTPWAQGAGIPVNRWEFLAGVYL